jgi:hypothetical protein
MNGAAGVGPFITGLFLFVNSSIAASQLGVKSLIGVNRRAELEPKSKERRGLRDNADGMSARRVRFRRHPKAPELIPKSGSSEARD